MMINCPNCNLLQPKDQYCARCGVNMETWQPPKLPLWKKILGNWMFQLGVLFLVILVVVMWDSVSNRKAPSSDPPPPTASELNRENLENFEETNSAPSQEEKIVENKQEGTSSFRQDTRQEPTPEKSTILSLRKQVSLKVMTINRSLLEPLAQAGRRIDEGVYVLTRRQGVAFVNENRRGIKGFGNAIRQKFQSEQPVELFFGEQDNETGRRLGFFSQVIVDENSSTEVISAEIRVWHHLKLNEGPSAPLIYDVVLKQQDGLYIVDPTIHDLEFTPDELALFDSSAKLQNLNGENFLERLSDVVLLIEIK